MSMENPDIQEGTPQEKSAKTKSAIESIVQQPALARIATLRAQSQLERTNEGSPTSTIKSKEGKEYLAKTVESGKDPVLDSVQDSWERAFSAAEVDPIETLKNAVDGITESGAEDTPYRVVTITEGDKLVTSMAGAPLEMKDAQGKETNEMVYFVGYAVTEPEFQGKGVAKEAYISALTDAMDIAQKEGKKLGFAVGECTASSEHYWNSVGWERVYMQKKDSAEYVEVPYIQPCLDFDPATGGFAEGAGEQPEHLMIDSFSRKPTKQDIKAAHEAFILYNSAYPREEFDSDEAFENKEKYIREKIDNFNKFIDESGSVMFMDAVTRDKVRTDGFKITEHYVPDSETSDPEDEKF